jgi:hypothetical protein
MGNMTAAPAGDRPPKPRNGKGRYIRAIDTIDRDRRAAELITQGWTYPQVAEHLSYSDKGDCWRAVQKIRREAAQLDGNSEQIRQRQLAEITEQRVRLWDQILHPPPAISRTGKIVTDDDGNEVPDAQATTAAHALLIRLSQREASIRGTDAPKRSVTLTGRPGPEEVLAFIEHVNPQDLHAAVTMLKHRADQAQREADAPGTKAIPGTLET